jgi:hypothetical protein
MWKPIAAAIAALTSISAASAANFDDERDICAQAIATELNRSLDDSYVRVKKARSGRVSRVTVQVKFADHESVVAECFIRSGEIEKVDLQ